MRNEWEWKDPLFIIFVFLYKILREGFDAPNMIVYLCKKLKVGQISHKCVLHYGFW